MNCRLKTILSWRDISASRSTLKWLRQLKSGADLCLIKGKKGRKKTVRGIAEERRQRRPGLPVSEKDTQYVFRRIKNAGDLTQREMAVFEGWRRRQMRQ